MPQFPSATSDSSRDPASAALGVARFGHGARPGDLARIGSDIEGALLAELDMPGLALLAEAGLPDSQEAAAAFKDVQRARKDGDRAAVKAAAAGYAPQAELKARLRQVTAAPIGFVERLVGFWSNHFAIEADKGGMVRYLSGPFEREAIRPHVLGRFGALLAAATAHPAMLLYLDNAKSIGPNSPAGQKRSKGLNENHARELLELHTLGVDGGYSQDDVIALAEILTGWGVGQGQGLGQGKGGQPAGTFAFRKAAHEPGPKSLLGTALAGRGEDQGAAALELLATHPATAQHIAFKLARHFVADTPPAELVARLATVFTTTEGDLGAVARALVTDPLAWGGSKLRSPQEFVYAGLRATGARPKTGQVLQALRQLGQVPMDPPSPAGFSDDSTSWLAPNAIATRVSVANMLARQAGDLDPREIAAEILGARLSAETAMTISRAESPAQGLALMLMSPEFQRR